MRVVGCINIVKGFANPAIGHKKLRHTELSRNIIGES